MATRVDGWKGLARWLPSGHRLSDARWRGRHRAMLWILWPHVPALWVLGVATGRGVTHVTAEVALLAVGAAVASSSAFTRRLRTLAAVLTLVGCSSVLVHFTDGLIESHFHFFAVVAAITLYQEWMPFAVAFVYVVAHHGIGGVLQPTAVYNHEAAWNRPVLWGLIHGGFVALAGVANLAAWRLAEAEREHAERVLDATGDGLYGIDASGRITFVNPVLCELLGQGRQTLEGADHHRALGHRLATGAAVDPADCPVCAAADSDEPLARGQACLRGPDDAALPVEYLARPLRDRRGEGAVLTLRDLREHHDLEAQRRRAEAERDELASVAAATTDLALIELPDGRVRWMNSAARALLGFDSAEDLGAYRIEDLFSAEEFARVHAEVVPVVARDGSWQGEWTLQARDGTHIPVAVTQHVHYDRDGERAYVSGIMKDLRPRLAAERELRDSERRLAEAEGVARLGSWEWDLVSNRVMWSPGMYRLHGMELGDRAESFDTWLATVHPDDRSWALEVAEEAAVTGTGVNFTYRAVRTDGLELVISGRGEVVADEHGQPTRMVGTLLDITDRHAAEKALRESEERARIVIATAGDAYIQFDRSGLINEWNRQAETTFGWTRQQALGQRLASLVTPDNRDPFERRLGLSADAGDDPFLGDRFELTVLDRAGRELPAEFTVWPVETGEDPVFGLFIRDISERRAAERAKDEFVSVVSHELRTPLTSIHGALGLLRAGVLGELTDRGQRMVDIAVDNTDRLVRLINDILDIERLDSGKVSLQRQDCDAAALVQRAVEVMRPMADEAGVRLEADTQRTTVWADPDRVEQTLVNLLSNAIKFSSAGATVWVTAQPDDDELVVCVRDQGRGIPPDQLETIFGRFQQVDTSDEREKGGTGLGLAICRTIVDQHGGRIWADSAPDEGATMTFTLPLVTWAEAGETQGAPKVLICDDDASVRGLVAAMLHSHGYEAIEVPSGAQLVDAALTHRPAAILLDLRMPVVDGWQAAAALRQRVETRDIPVVILSVLDPETAEGPPGVAGRLGKPVHADTLIAALHRVIDGAASGARLLLVEDDQGLADVLAERFRLLGVEVLHAATAEAALALCTEHVPDLLVLDLLLPDQDGFAVVAQLRRHDRLRGVPLVVYTACDLSEAERGRLRLGTTQFFTKGCVTSEEFERHVVDLLDHITETANERTHA